ncbi:MAG: septum formation initiator family protein [Candidatus Aminicenantes bacterium]|nr:septum formation initiator family protein [Candidatus Aminicenantes bacterium]
MRQKTKPSMSIRNKLLISGAAFLFLVFFIASFFGERGLIEVYQTQKKCDALAQEKSILLEKKQKLERDIQELMSNPSAVEKRAREKLWLMKPDELVIIFR